MPGILPMKVIKVGASAQARIAQACDRCRSKKIRCDGIRPCCTQCANVGFECKTSDKLSRRAFPRGYTESLEERVRSLETEVRELKDLLDEKDEKIDMLSRIHSQSSQPIQLPSPRRPSTTSIESAAGSAKPSETPEKDEVFKVQQSPYLLAGDGAESYFAGTSSGRTFIEAFKHRVQEKGRSTADIHTDRLLASSLRKGADPLLTPTEPVVWKAPPRLVSDQLVNIYFQEWAPLFPVLHRPAFLTLYEKYVADPDSVTDKTAIAQLNLVFGIAALSSGTRASGDLESFESQWKAAIDTVLTENTMQTLQTLILAQIFCVQQGDLTKVLTYKGLSTTLSARLGLHQSQKRFALGTLTSETRKKVFWTLYTLDSFTAVIIGLPKHLKDDDVHCEYPVDADDEYVTERGFQPTLPGESTKLSSALALFRAARILSKVLEEVFPAKASYELSLKRLSELSDELDAWSSSLAPHLRLHFVQDKPSTGVISSRSPLLSLTYHYIRALIHRPAICAPLGSHSSSYIMTHASSCKHIIQILQLLEERGLSFSFCLNKDEILVLSGFGLLFQGLTLDAGSKILKDNHKMLNGVIDMLKKSKAPCTSDFARVARSFLPGSSSDKSSSSSKTAPQTITPPPKSKVVMPLSRHNSDPSITITPHESLPSSTKKQLKAIASRFTSNTKTPKLDVSKSVDHRRATVHNISLHPNGVPSQSQPSLQPASAYNPASMSRSEPARSPVNMHSRPAPAAEARTSLPPAPPAPLKPKSRLPQQHKNLNLDYLSFGSDTETQPQSRSAPPVKPDPQPTDWERLLGCLDNGTTNIYDACYGGPAIDSLLDTPPLHDNIHSMSTADKHNSIAEVNDASINWNADLWAALCQTDSHTSADSGFSSAGGHPDSLLSFSTSDEGHSNSADDLMSTADWHSVADSVSGATKSGSVNGSTSGKSSGLTPAAAFRGIVMPADTASLSGVHGDDLTFGSSWDGELL